MIISDKIETVVKEDVTALTNEHKDALFQWINLVQPVYFRKQTSLLGNYFGIIKTRQLISVAGVPMKMNDCVEISAIVPQPGHTCRRYAKQLIAPAGNSTFNQ